MGWNADAYVISFNMFLNAATYDHVDTLVIQTRAFELAALREQGRQTIQHLISHAKAQYAACRKDDEFRKLHQWLVEEVRRLEQDQHAGFLAVSHWRGGKGTGGGKGGNVDIQAEQGAAADRPREHGASSHTVKPA
jgi:hypothetical protein